MKRTVVGVLTCAMVVALLGVAPAAARGGVRIANVFEIDELGNAASGAALTLNGSPIAMGDRIGTGLIQNTGSRPVVLALSSGTVLKLNSGEVAMIDVAADATRKCQCKCNAENTTLSETDATKCSNHTGERCQASNGLWYNLVGCGLTWVSTVAEPEPMPIDPAQS